MIEFGKTLKAAREAKGYSVTAIAEATHMMSRIVESLENEDFSKFPAPIYGRGFVKLYCEAVGLDPKPFVAEFMEIYSGNRDPAIRERPVAPTPAPEPIPVDSPHPPSDPTPQETPPPEEPSAPDETPPEPEATNEPEPVADVEVESAPTEIPPELRDLELFNPEAFVPPTETVTPPAATVSPEKPLPRNPTPANTLLGDKDELRFTRYSAPFRDTPSELPNLRPMIGRLAVLIGGALLLLWAIFAGLRALYRATTARPASAPEQSEVCDGSETRPSATASETPPPAAGKVLPTARKPYPVDPLYID